MEHFKIELKERSIRRRTLLSMIREIHEYLDTITKRPANIAAYTDPKSATIVADISHKACAVTKRCSILQMKKSTYKMCFNTLNDIKSNIPQNILEYGSNMTLLQKYTTLDVTHSNNLFRKHFEFFKGRAGLSVSQEPELDSQYNTLAAQNKMFVRKLYPAITNSLQEHLHGGKVFVPQGSSYTVLYGMFDYDEYQLTSSKLPLYVEVEKYIQNMSCYKDQQTFMARYLRSLQLREFMVNTIDELKTTIMNAYKESLQLEKKSFTEIQKMFQSASTLRQRKIIVILLVSNNVSKYAVPLMESLKDNSEKKQLIQSLGSLQPSLASCSVALQKEIDSFDSSKDAISMHSRIMMMKVDPYIKTKALEKLKEANSGRESGTKAQQYVDGLLKVPFGVYRKEPIFSSTDTDQRKEYIRYVGETLNSCVHGHDEAKLHIQRLIGQWMNGKLSGSVFGFQGPPGTGKTTLAKNGFARCLIDDNGNSRPLAFIPLGGTSSGSLLEGHGYTYMGSTWGRIIDVLIEKQCMNPIIYIDELDKVSASDRGQEIIGILTHLTDPSQNSEFNDRYFAGIKFDLSQAIFIFSYNDSSKIDKVLRDRINEIHTSALTKSDKITITKNFVMPEILENVGLENEDFTIESAVVETIIDEYTYEAGVRKLKERLYDIARDVNLKGIQGELELPFCVTPSYVQHLFCDKPRALRPKIYDNPCVGMVNGLYANSMGLGGITRIEAHKSIGEKLELQLTGSQGKVMQESMKCARTLAWNLLSSSVKECIGETAYGLHIHCPEAATAKDGPSAGVAITTAIVSRLLEVPVRHDIAMTGEIDLNGNVHAIGGLDAKLFGAIQCGVRKVFIPEENRHDFERFEERYPDSAGCLNVSLVKHIGPTLLDCLLGEIEDKVA